MVNIPQLVFIILINSIFFLKHLFKKINMQIQKAIFGGKLDVFLPGT